MKILSLLFGEGRLVGSKRRGQGTAFNDSVEIDWNDYPKKIKRQIDEALARDDGWPNLVTSFRNFRGSDAVGSEENKKRAKEILRLNRDFEVLVICEGHLDEVLLQNLKTKQPDDKKIEDFSVTLTTAQKIEVNRLCRRIEPYLRTDQGFHALLASPYFPHDIISCSPIAQSRMRETQVLSDALIYRGDSTEKIGHDGNLHTFRVDQTKAHKKIWENWKKSETFTSSILENQSALKTPLDALTGAIAYSDPDINQDETVKPSRQAIDKFSKKARRFWPRTKIWLNRWFGGKWSSKVPDRDLRSALNTKSDYYNSVKRGEFKLKTQKEAVAIKTEERAKAENESELEKERLERANSEEMLAATRTELDLVKKAKLELAGTIEWGKGELEKRNLKEAELQRTIQELSHENEKLEALVEGVHFIEDLDMGAIENATENSDDDRFMCAGGTPGALKVSQGKGTPKVSQGKGTPKVSQGKGTPDVLKQQSVFNLNSATLYQSEGNKENETSEKLKQKFKVGTPPILKMPQ